MSPSEGSGRRVSPKPLSTGSSSNLPFAGLAGLDLNPRLLADADIGIGRTAIGLPVERQRHAGQALHRRDAARLQLIDLELRYAGNEAKMIVIAAALVASLPPAADVAMLDRIGIGVICRRPQPWPSAAPRFTFRK